MKYTNTYNGHTYWIEGDKVKVSNGEAIHTSHMDIPTFNAMVFNGDMVEIPVDKKNFADLVKIEKLINPGLQIRFVAYIAHVGFHTAYEGNVASRNARFMAWISDRKADYGQDVIESQEDFTDFIISGAWL